MRFLSSTNVPLIIALSLVLGAGSASAEDVTGVYAGMNAGYAFGHDRERGGTFALPSGPSASADDRGLPPSAQSASRALQAGRSGSR